MIKFINVYIYISIIQFIGVENIELKSQLSFISKKKAESQKQSWEKAETQKFSFQSV